MVLLCPGFLSSRSGLPLRRVDVRFTGVASLAIGGWATCTKHDPGGGSVYEAYAAIEFYAHSALLLDDYGVLRNPWPYHLILHKPAIITLAQTSLSGAARHSSPELLRAIRLLGWTACRSPPPSANWLKNAIRVGGQLSSSENRWRTPQHYSFPSFTLHHVSHISSMLYVLSSVFRARTTSTTCLALPGAYPWLLPTYC